MRNYEELSIEELESLIESTQEEVYHLMNEEQAIKLVMNSIYGVIGNKGFVCYNIQVAESITLQGQDLIKYAEKCLDKYFHQFWHNDKELHEKLGITEVEPVVDSMVKYGDTDSVLS